MNKPIKIKFWIESLSVEYGGPSSSIPSLIKQLIKLKYPEDKIEVIGCDYISPIPSKLYSDLPVKLKVYRSLISNKFRFSLKVFGEEIKERDKVLHVINNSWNLWMLIPFLLSRIKNQEYIVYVRGAISEYSLSQKNVKKSIASFLYQRTIYRNAKYVICTSKYEMDYVNKYVRDRVRTVLIPHGIHLSEIKEIRINKLPSKNIKYLFCGRLHSKKGLNELFEAIKTLKSKNLNFDITFVGYDEQNWSKKLLSLNGGSIKIDYLGSVTSEQLKDVYMTHDILILPSYFENYAMVVAEALSFGLGVVVSQYMPWHEIEKFGAGIVINNVNKDDIVRCVMKLDGMSYDELTLMKSRAFQYSLENLSIEKTALQFKALI